MPAETMIYEGCPNDPPVCELKPLDVYDPTEEGTLS